MAGATCIGPQTVADVAGWVDHGIWYDAGALHGVPLAAMPDDPVLRSMAATRGISGDLIDARLWLHGTTLGEVREHRVANA